MFGRSVSGSNLPHLPNSAASPSTSSLHHQQTTPTRRISFNSSPHQSNPHIAIGIPPRPSNLSSVSQPGSFSSSLPNVTVNEAQIRSDLTQVVQKLEKENTILRESLKKVEDQKMAAEIKAKQLEIRYGKLESVLSLLHHSLLEKEKEKERENKGKSKELQSDPNEPQTLVEAPKAVSSQSSAPFLEASSESKSSPITPSRSLLSMEISRARELSSDFTAPALSASVGESSKDEPTNQKSSDPASFEGEEEEEEEEGIPFKLDKQKGLHDGSDQDAIVDSFLSADGARILAEGLDWIRKDATGLLQEVLEENSAVQSQHTPLLVSNRFASNEYQLLAKKYAVLHDELSKMRESYRNQSVILAECEKKLDEALTDKAEVIQSKLDVLKLQSTYGLTWVPDDCVKECLQCGYVFTFFARQHHCRLCGRLFCANCTTNSCAIPTLGYDTPVRVCDHCYLVLLSQKKHEKGVDMVALEYDQTRDRILRKYGMWDDGQKNTFLEQLLESSSLVQLCYLYRALGQILETYNIGDGGSSKGHSRAQSINNVDWEYEIEGLKKDHSSSLASSVRNAGALLWRSTFGGQENSDPWLK